MTDPAVVRTAVPLVVSYVAGVLASLGVTLPPSVAAMVSQAAGVLVAGGYYIVVRRLEKRWPRLSVLLGSRQQPVGYVKPAASLEK